MRPLVLLLLLASPCIHAQKCKTYPEKDRDPSAYPTYNWVPGRTFTAQGWVNDPPSTPIIQREVDKELQARGYRRVDSGGAMTVSFLGSQDKNMQVDTNVDSYYFGPMPTSPIPTTSRAYKQGTLAIALVDPNGKKPIFVSICSAAIDNESQLEKKIAKAAEKSFKNLPAANANK